VESTPAFLTKAAKAVELVRSEVPPCCQGHRVPEVEGERRDAKHLA
jgi:hypothetical protein